jgi:hypothetical protein
MLKWSWYLSELQIIFNDGQVVKIIGWSNIVTDGLITLGFFGRGGFAVYRASCTREHEGQGLLRGAYIFIYRPHLPSC